MALNTMFEGPWKHVSGVGSGLQLILNVEKYEYIFGPNQAAGVMVRHIMI